MALSRKEFAVLAELLRADGGVVSAEQLLEKAWDEHTDPFTGVVRFTIMNVRRKLGEPPVIQTVAGTGYRIPMTTPTPRRRWRSTIRVRLTLLYAGALFLAGAVLIVLMYLYLAHALDGQLTARIGATAQLHESTASGSPHLSRDVQQELRARFQQDRDHVLKAMLVASLISLGVVGVIAAGFGWLMAGRALRPLQQITATARRVADRSLHERIGLDGPDDEIRDLADTFDAMLERLDRSFDSQRRFVANASHELLTPLTLNRTLIEVTLTTPTHTNQRVTSAPPCSRSTNVTSGSSTACSRWPAASKPSPSPRSSTSPTSPGISPPGPGTPHTAPTSRSAPICGPPRSPATRSSWNGSPRTCSTTPSATTCPNTARS